MHKGAGRPPWPFHRFPSMPNAIALPLPGSLTPARFMALFAFLAPALAVLSPRGEAPLLIAGSILGLGLIYALSGVAPRARGRSVILVLALIAWGWISIAWSWTPKDGIAQGLQLT